mmetsp:Transcript_10783/g.21083  ORF Transcript_10783/g.21083 Transcript_10783/m.21083 type:complete len:231 (-) Transcript_10783:2925-3617(-)
MHRKKNATGVPTSFLQKTYDILCDDSLISVVGWLEDGKSFVVRNVKEFCEKVLPMYFKHGNFTSFVRQLNMYDFHKIREEDNVFQHPQFQKDKPHLLKDIVRKTSDSSVTSRTFLSRADCSILLAKLYSLNAHQQDLEYLIMSLQSKYQEIRSQNQMLINELYNAQMREQRIEELLVDLASFISKLQTADYRNFRRYPMLALPQSSPDSALEFLEDMKEDPVDFFFSQQL